MMDKEAGHDGSGDEAEDDGGEGESAVDGRACFADFDKESEDVSCKIADGEGEKADKMNIDGSGQ